MRKRRCVMCDAPTPYTLDPRDWNKRGRAYGVCGPCFNHDGKLAHAVAFARAMWAQEERR